MECNELQFAEKRWHGNRKRKNYESFVKKKTYLDKVFNDSKVPVVVSTDYMRAYPEQIRPYLFSDFYVLGTDGFGRSDSRQRLREF